jgi:hypothetical protein
MNAPLPPQNLDAEDSVLAAILFAGADGPEVSAATLAAITGTGLQASDFYRESHALIYAAAHAVRERGEATTRLALEAELGDRKQLKAAGGKERLQELAALAPATANARSFARRIVEAADQREDFDAASALRAAALNGGLRANPEVREQLGKLVGPRRSSEAEGVRTRGVIYERVRPLRWLWERRFPFGLLALLVGEEGVGKGTLVAWVIARTTCGQLGGDLEGEPARVLIVGDEDAFEPIWVPRLYAANADLTKVRTLDDGEFLDDLAPRADDLAATIRRDEIALVVFDQLLDHIPGGAEGQAIYNPKHIRQAMLPLRRVAATTNVAMLGLLHPIKGRVSTFRQLIAGSHQFNAVSRSSLLLGVDPDDERRRILVRGKGNHSAMPRSFEFALAAEDVELGGHRFEVPKVVREGEGDRTIHDLLAAGPATPARDELARPLTELLYEEPQSLADLARAVGRDPKDGSVRNTLQYLADEGIAEKVGRGQWKRRA